MDQTRSVGAAQSAHGELDVAGRQFAPAFHRAHIAGLRITGQEIARLRPRLLARQREGLAQVTVIGLPPCRHAVGQIPRAKGHLLAPASRLPSRNFQVATSKSQLPSRNSQVATPKSQLPSRNSQVATSKSQLQDQYHKANMGTPKAACQAPA